MTYMNQYLEKLNYQIKNIKQYYRKFNNSDINNII